MAEDQKIRNVIPEGHLGNLWATNHSAMAIIDREFIRAQRYLDNREYEVVRKITASNLASTLHRVSSDPEALSAQPTNTTSGTISEQLSALAEYLRGYVDRNAEKVARQRLARGLIKASLASIGLLIVVTLGIVIVLRITSLTIGVYEVLTIRDTVVCVGGASIGAVTSVLLRIRHVERLEYETLDQGAANYRVALGWLFGAALLLLTKGGVLTVIAEPSEENPTTAGFYWAALGFLAGFNERWAGSLLTRDRDESNL